MADGSINWLSNQNLEQADVAQLIDVARAGAEVPGLVFADVIGIVAFNVPEGINVSWPLILGDDLILVQPDGSLTVLGGAMGENLVLLVDGFRIPVARYDDLALHEETWQILDDVEQVTLLELSGGTQTNTGGSGEEEIVSVGDPLVGLAINPLLPPVEYEFPEYERRETGNDGGIGPPDVNFDIMGEAVLSETDATLAFRPDDFVDVVAGGFEDGERITQISISIENLPAGTTANFGTFTNDGGLLTFEFSGTPGEFANLVLTFPKDFSTDNRNDGPNGSDISGDLIVSISANSNFGQGTSTDFPLTITVEGDVEIQGTGVLADIETDAPIDFKIADALTPVPTDADGSESIIGVTLTLFPLPPGTLISLTGAEADFAAVGPNFVFQGSLAEYEEIVVRLPRDFSTNNPPTRLGGTLTAVTDENGMASRQFTIEIEATPDIVIIADSPLTAMEDMPGPDGSGVLIDPMIEVRVEDIDGSEDNTIVSIEFANLPPGTTFSRGIFQEASVVWRGTLDDANNLTFQLPGDFSGSVSWTIRATNLEGEEDASQELVVTPKGDVDIDVDPIVVAETDAPVTINPSSEWIVSISDLDPGLPLEALTEVTLTLRDLPPGVTTSAAFPGFPDGTPSITYDPANGGDFTFVGTGAQYEQLRITFPQDYSTAVLDGSDTLIQETISGEITGVSTEGKNGPVPVELTITPEGDVTIDVLTPDNLIETDAALTFALGDYLDPKVIDLDSLLSAPAPRNEIFETIEVTIAGLPNDPLGRFDLTSFSGLPAGATLTYDPSGVGPGTLTATFTGRDAADLFSAVTVTVPPDFSTANRSDLGAGETTLPIQITISVVTNEDQISGDDTAIDGEATATAEVNIDFTHDINLDVGDTVIADEDGGIPDVSVGVTVDLGLSISVDDTDDSEDQENISAPFGSQVTIQFSQVVGGLSANRGAVDPLTGEWTGSVDDANNLQLRYPGDYSGTTLAQVTVETPEGIVQDVKQIIIRPVIDVAVDGRVEVDETDADLVVLLSSFVTVDVVPPNETLYSIDFTLDDLPPGTQAIDRVSGDPVGTFTTDPTTGLLSFEYQWTQGDPGPSPADAELVFPTDFSTASPDPDLPLVANLSIETIQGGTILGPEDFDVEIRINYEEDITLVVNPVPPLAETDDFVAVRPFDYLQPGADDNDGSEFIDAVSLIFPDLPPGTEYDIGAGRVAAPLPAFFDGVEYQNLIIYLPPDFSTENPGTTLEAQFTATTNEGGFVQETLTITLSAEGDLDVTGPGTITLSENDPAGSIDTDATTELPLEFSLTQLFDAQASDADGSESIEEVTVTFDNLPDDALYSVDGGLVFNAVPSGVFTLGPISKAEYDDLVIRLPDDFSTESPDNGPLTGTVIFATDESIAAGETPTPPNPNDGIEQVAFEVNVDAEGDIRITGQDITRIEDLGAPIPLELDVAITDIDGSERLEDLRVTFTGLPTNGDTILSDGTVLNPANNVWTGTEAELLTLAIDSFPTHFSGRITMDVDVTSNEGTASDQFLLDITPVAEPEIEVSIDTDATTFQLGPKNFSTKEDTPAQLRIEATTADKDTSEALTMVVVENIPTNWLTNGDGNVDPSKIIEGDGQIASASVSGTTLTIMLNAGVTDFTGVFQLQPEADRDEDVATLLGGNEITATVTSVDMATGLPTDTQTAADFVDLDVDAVVDDLAVSGKNRNTDEDTTNVKRFRLGLEDVALSDTDGSEFITGLELTIDVATLSDNYDPNLNSNLRLFAGGGTSGAIDIVRVPIPGTSSTSFTLSKAAGATDAEFQDALTELRIEVPQHFSGVLSNSGTISWQETQTVDAPPGGEFDISDNFATDSTFTSTITVRPIAEATLALDVFVLDGGATDPLDFTDNDVVDGAPMSVSGEAKNGESITIAEIMQLRESTLDGTGPGTNPPTLPDGSINDQVQVYLGLNASTPDRDGSEELENLVISNVPTDWYPTSWQGGTVPQSEWILLRSLSGDAPILQAELDKIQSIRFDPTGRVLTIEFVDDVVEFSASLVLEPTPYEDWDPDQVAPFGVVRPFNATGETNGTSEGEFFGHDITAVVSTRDGNTKTEDTETAEVEVDIDVAPVNNLAVIVVISVGNEAVIDNLPGGPSGIWDINIILDHDDKDGSEIITAVVLRAIPSGVSVFVPSVVGDPTSPYVPALITQINPDGSSDWSLEDGAWENVQFRGVPLHLAGDFPLQIDAVTTEFDGGGTRVSSYNEILRIEPVADGGNPRGNGSGVEDTPFGVNISANIIDSAALLVDRPNDISKEIVDRFRLVDGDFPRDSFGRPFLLFEGPPQIDPANPPDLTDPYNETGYLNLIDPTAWIDWSVVPNLTMLAGIDSNEELTFQIEVEYVEEIKPSEVTTNIGTVSIEVEGVADTPITTAQQEDPTLTPNGIALADIDAVYRANSFDTDGPGGIAPGPIQNYNRVYGYAGDDSAPFLLNQRLTDNALENGFASLAPDEIFQAADPITGIMTETTAITGGTPFDGSETLYYLITGVPPGGSFLGVTPVDPTGETYLVTAQQLATLAFVPPDVDVVTYYDLSFYAIVIEDDVSPTLISSTRALFLDPISNSVIDIAGFLNAIATDRGAAFQEETISIVLLPEDTGGGDNCPDVPLDVPTISLKGSGLEDEAAELKLHIDPSGNPQYQDILDLINLPTLEGIAIQGDLGILIDLPPGSQISADPPGSIIYDPVSGGWAIDLQKFLSGNGDGDTVSSGTIFYTPPAHESSPVNPFNPTETFGPDDPYDNLPDLELSMVLNDITCGTTTTGTGSLDITIAPVLDPAIINVSLESQAPTADYPTPEDQPIDLNISVSSPDGGERIVPGSSVVITINGTHIGGPLSSLDQTLGLEQSGLYDAGGKIIDDGRLQIIGGDYVYTLDQADLAGLYIIPKNHIHGELTVSVAVQTEDIDLAPQTWTGSGSIEIDAIADEPAVDIDETLLDPETGLPVAVLNDNGTPDDVTDDFVVVTAIEDQRIFLQQIAPAFTPDMDGSEFLSAVFIPDPNLEIGATRPLTSIIDNGDGTFTIALEDFDKIWLKLKDEHARTPDNLDPTVPSQVEVDIRLISYELPNGDEFEFDSKFFIQVRPDADKPELVASVTPTTGVEDQPQPYEIVITGNTPDPHEAMQFEVAIQIPSGGFDPANLPVFELDGTPLTLQFSNPADPDDPYGGVPHAFVVLDGQQNVSVPGVNTFIPNGQLTFIPPQDFGGDTASLKVTAITIDDVPAPWSGDGYIDNERSDVLELTLDIAVSPDLDFDLRNPTVSIDETDAPLDYTPTTDIDIDLTDQDGSETIEIIYELDNVPDGTSYTIGGTTTPVPAGPLSITLTSVADFNDLTITFPADFATDSGVINGTVSATTNEGGNAGGAFTLEINGTSDLDVTVTTTASTETGAALVIPLGIDATINDNTPTAYEFLETVEIAFDAPLPAGTIASAGTIAPDGSSLLLERNGAAPAVFVPTVAALTLTIPPGFADDIVADITVTSTHDTQVFTDQTYSINGAPDIVAPPIDIVSTTTTTVLTFAELTATATDPDTPLIVENVSSDDPAISSIVVDQGAQTVTIDVAAGYDATSILTYDIVDSGVGPARTTTTANLDIDTLQMVSIGQQVGADGITREVMSDVAGTVGRTDFAKGTADADLVTHTGAPDRYTDIAGFRMEGGNDLVDLSAASNGFDVDLGTGDDIAIGSSGDDILTGGIGADQLTGGAGFDTLQGGLGDDTFILDALPSVTDVITDYGTGADQIDITALVNGVATVTDAEADYNPLTGALDVLGAQAYLIQGLPPSVEVIFENASGVAEVATLT